MKEPKWGINFFIDGENQIMESSSLSTTEASVKFVHGDFFGEFFLLIFAVDDKQIRVNLTKNAITFPRQSMVEIKGLLTVGQYRSLIKQLYDFIFDLN
jgi:hypothetical protein